MGIRRADQGDPIIIIIMVVVYGVQISWNERGTILAEKPSLTIAVSEFPLSSVVHPSHAMRDNGCAHQPAIKITHSPLPLPGQIMSTAQEIKPTYANDDPPLSPSSNLCKEKVLK